MARLSRVRSGIADIALVLDAVAQGLVICCGLFDAKGTVLWVSNETVRRYGLRTLRVDNVLFIGRIPSQVEAWQRVVRSIPLNETKAEWDYPGLVIRRLSPGASGPLYFVTEVDRERVAKAFPGSSLTAREKEVAMLAAEGFSALNIAAQLGVSELTVRSHLRSIYRKLGIGSQAELQSLLGPHPVLKQGK
jgi:DNA-binding CsgD family transcriptional regulator